MKSRFTTEQIIRILKEHEAGVKTKDIVREHGISEQTFYRWKSKYGGMDVNEAKRLKELEEENSKLKRLLGDKELQILGLQGGLAKKLLTPQQKRIAAEAVESQGNSIKTSCHLVGISRNSWYYTPKADEVNTKVLERMKELAHERPRFGSPRLTVLIRNELGTINHKRIERLYQGAGLQLPRRRKKRRWLGRQISMHVPEAPNERWSMDFVHDKTRSGRKLRVFNIVDDYSRELIACIPSHSFTGHRVVRELEQLVDFHEITPKSFVMDNGPEFTSRAFLSWAYNKQIQLDFIQPGKPVQNAFVESFNGKFRDECLNMNWFKDLNEAVRIIDEWKYDYNYKRPHSSLGNVAPMEYKNMRFTNI